MAPVTSLPINTLADLLDHLGGIPPERVRIRPTPGRATGKDLLSRQKKEGKVFELIEGVLVEKPMGFEESRFALFLGGLMNSFIIPHNLGILSGADGPLRFAKNLVFCPDLAFVSWERLPRRKAPKGALPSVIPDLAIEILSKSNTPREMARKRGHYFSSGVQQVWEIHTRGRTLTVFTSPEESKILGIKDTLLGDPLLPGFSLSLKQLFAELDRRG